MPPEIQSAGDLWGLEFDWLASDADDHVALFSSAGGGYLPEAAWQNAKANQAAIDAILALPPVDGGAVRARTECELRKHMATGVRTRTLRVRLRS